MLLRFFIVRVAVRDVLHCIVKPFGVLLMVRVAVRDVLYGIVKPVGVLLIVRVAVRDVLHCITSWSVAYWPDPRRYLSAMRTEQCVDSARQQQAKVQDSSLQVRPAFP